MNYTAPFPYQRVGVDQIHSHAGRFMLADEMGLGKSYQALLYAHEAPDVRRTVIVCKAALKHNWQAECLKHFGTRAEILSGRKPTKGNPLGVVTTCPFLIINFEILNNWLPVLLEYAPDLVVVDESQNFGNPTAQRTKALKKLVARTHKFIAMSGGPIENHVIQWWPILNMLWPSEFPSRLLFGDRYCLPVVDRGGISYIGGQRAEELNNRVNALGYARRLTKDVKGDLPPLTINIMPMDVADAKKKAALHEEWVELSKWYRSTRYATQVDPKLGRQRRAKYMRLIREAAMLKMPSVFEWMDEFFLSGEKLLLFAHHRVMIDMIMDRYAKQYHGVKIDGRVSTLNRERARAQFMQDRNCKLMVGEHKAAGEGLTLTSAHYVAFAELPWSPILMRQNIKRIHRIGQTHPCFAYIFVAANTVEERLCHKMKKKEEYIDAAVEGTNGVGPASIFDMLDLPV